MGKKGLGKRGDEKYYILISFILGLLILGIVFVFIFQEYFGDEEINRETCRQSIILRNYGFDSKKPIDDWLSQATKSGPLKCKNDIITLDYDGKNIVIDRNGKKAKVNSQDFVFIAKKVIAEELIACDSLFGYGQLKIFPTQMMEQSLNCVICSRVSFSPTFVEAMKKTPSNKPLVVMDYLFDYGLDGNLVSESGGADSIYGYLSKTKSVAQKIDKFKFLIDRQIKDKSTDWGVRNSIYPEKGSVLIGFYSYLNREYWEWDNLLGNTLYSNNYVFYVQPGIEEDREEFAKCQISGILV